MEKQETKLLFSDLEPKTEMPLEHIQKKDTDRINHVIDEMKHQLEKLDVGDKIEAINQIKIALHAISPFNSEPVDCVLWIKSDRITANDYNPNTVAPPEMKLLEHSIGEDGYTQPIVSWMNEGKYEVVDGFHRHRVGSESKKINKRILGYLPLTVINDQRTERMDRMASTIRHNRARGKHQIGKMSDIVIELKRRNWTDERIAKELGMDQDEILRLCQITGLVDVFSDQEFSKSWDVEGQVTEADFKELSDDTSTYGEEVNEFRTLNTDDENRIFHTYDKWECYRAGFYNSSKPGMTKDECEAAYKRFLSDIPKFKEALAHVISEWKYSCEHYLTNSAMNRIAWLGQAAMCYATGVPAAFRSGFFLLSDAEQALANEAALEALNEWLKNNNRPAVSMEQAYTGRQSDIY
jgi:ParB-like chromosome segregation protein Spo0J